MRFIDLIELFIDNLSTVISYSALIYILVFHFILFINILYSSTVLYFTILHQNLNDFNWTVIIQVEFNVNCFKKWISDNHLKKNNKLYLTLIEWFPGWSTAIFIAL